MSAIAQEPDDVVMAVLPFFHIYGMNVIMSITLKQRAKLVTMPRFDLDEFLRLIHEQRISFLYIAPPMAVALAVIGVLLLAEPDMGAFMVIAAIALGVLFLGGVNGRMFLLSVAVLLGG